MNTPLAGPILVLGLMQRTGTNFLRDLLVRHPACGGTEILAEDFLVHHAELLEQYAGWVQLHWARERYPAEVEHHAGLLLHDFGRTLTGFTRRLIDAERPVLKTPSVRNVRLFFEIFDDAGLLLIVRDGRSVVESGMRSFDWDFETATRQWAAAVDTVIDFRERMGDRDLPWTLVRYERLVTDLRDELTRALLAVDLDPDVYDFEAAERLPVKGSSTYRGGERDVHWEEVPRSEAFRPLERWADWPRARHERFNWLAGRQLRALGYEPEERGDGRATWAAWNRLHDADRTTRRLAGKAAGRMRRGARRVGAALRRRG